MTNQEREVKICKRLSAATGLPYCEPIPDPDAERANALKLAAIHAVVRRGRKQLGSAELRG